MKAILTEIGELFGRYKTSDGNYDTFGNIATMITRGNALNQAQAPQQEIIKSFPFFKGPVYTTFNTSGSRPFYGWQKDVVNILNNPNKDIYIAASPGAGKTTPVMAISIINKLLGGKTGSISDIDPQILVNSARQSPKNIIDIWANGFLTLLTGRNLNKHLPSKTLFITPIRVLSFEQAGAFQEYYIDIILFLKQLINYFIIDPERDPNNYFHNNNNKLKSKNDILTILKDNQFLQNNQAGAYRVLDLVLSNINDNLYRIFVEASISDFESWVDVNTKQMICVKTGGGAGDYQSEPRNATAIISTYGSAKNFIKLLSPQLGLIVFDEAQKDVL